MRIAAEDDVVRARQIARNMAAEIGFQRQDQTRIATAVSEIARNAFMYGGGGSVRCAVDDKAARQSLVITVEDRGKGVADLQAVLDGSYESASGMGIGIRGARRLMDEFTIDSVPGDGTRVVLRKYLPARAVSKLQLSAVAQRLASDMATGPLVEIREQNRELIATLEELRGRQEELAELNRELADTNRGVVALYAELDQKAEDLRRANEMKTRFLSNMSHEIRTPINSILALSRLLLDRADGPLTEEQERQVNYIREAGESLSELISDLLDLAKIESGKIAVRPTSFTVAELFGALRGMFRPLLRRDVPLIFEEPRDLPPLITDETKLAQILRNFISNALKFTERGEIRVSASAEQGGSLVTFAVQDTGVGIAPEHLDYIFEEFTQVESPLQAKVKGTGLGLPLTRQLAGLLGGAVHVDSELGRGSTFSVTIPTNLRPSGQVLEPDEVAASEQPKPPRSALVIDDDPAARYVVRQILRQLGNEIWEADNGAAGIELAVRRQPELILLDLRMPGLDGFSILERLAADPQTAHIPVIIVTSSELTQDERSRLRRAVAVLSKAELSAATLSSVLLERTAQTQA